MYYDTHPDQDKPMKAWEFALIIVGCLALMGVVLACLSAHIDAELERERRCDIKKQEYINTFPDVGTTVYLPGNIPARIVYKKYHLSPIVTVRFWSTKTECYRHLDVDKGDFTLAPMNDG